MPVTQARPESKNESRQFWREIIHPLVCCAVVLGFVLLANPFGSAGFVDDWSYSHMALKLAQTGHLKYEGWGSPTLLFQTLWAAPWIHLLGFSFDLMRAITLPFALGFVLLTYATGRKVGLRRDLSLFGALIVGTAPLFLPLAASFMTDMYGCFFSLLCIYSAICSAEAPSGRLAIFWLWTLSISGILGGSDRQIVWVAPIALVPYLFWLKRSDRRFSVHATIAYVLCLAALALINSRFKPPYAPFALRGDEIWTVVWQNALSTSAILIGMLLACLLISLPALLCFKSSWRELGFARLVLILIASFGAILALTTLAGQFGAAPFTMGILSQFGILMNGWDSLGYKPVVLQPWLRICISVLVVFTGLAFILLQRSGTKFARTPRSIFLIFSSAYITLLLPGAILGITFDRYLLPLVPMIVLFILDRFQHGKQRIPNIAWIWLLVCAAYSVAITHDYASASRVRVRAADLLRSLGIPRRHISAGFEYDAWTQLESTGTIAGAAYKDSFDWNTTDHFWFWHYTTALRPDYVVSSSRTAIPGALVAVPFGTWLPPFRRFAIAQPRRDLPKSPLCNTLLPCSMP